MAVQEVSGCPDIRCVEALFDRKDATVLAVCTEGRIVCNGPPVFREVCGGKLGEVGAEGRGDPWDGSTCFCLILARIPWVIEVQEADSCTSSYLIPFKGLQFALTVVMPTAAMAHISLRIFIFNHSDKNLSGGLIEYLAMKMMNSIGNLGVLEGAWFLSGWTEALPSTADKEADASS